MKNLSATQNPQKPVTAGLVAKNDPKKPRRRKRTSTHRMVRVKLAPSAMQSVETATMDRETAATRDALMPKGNELSEAARRFIIQSLACFVKPSEIVLQVKELFSVDVTRQRLQRYDPTTTNGKSLCASSRELFASTRATYLREIGNIGIANQRYRLDSLQEEHDRAKERGNQKMVKELLQHAAMEVGGCFGKRTIASDDSLEFLAKLLDIPIEEIPPPCPPRDIKKRR